MLDMGDQVARRQRRRLGDEVLCPARARLGAHHAVAQDVLLGQDDEVRSFKAALETQTGNGEGRRIQLQRLWPVRHLADRRDAMVGHDAAHAFHRTIGPAGDQHAFAGSLQSLEVIGSSLEDIQVAAGPFRREVAAQLAAGIHAARALGRLEGRQFAHDVLAQRCFPVGIGQIQRIGL